MQKVYVLLANEDDTEIDFHGPFEEPEKSAAELIRERRPFSASVRFLVVDFDQHDVKFVRRLSEIDHTQEAVID